MECVLILRIALREGGDSVLAGSPTPRAKIGSWQIKIALKREARRRERGASFLSFSLFPAVLLLQGVTCRFHSSWRKILLCLRRKRGRSSKKEKRNSLQLVGGVAGT